MTDTYAKEAFSDLIPKAEIPLAPERMIELGLRHERFEFDDDIDGVLSTLVDEPVYELHPQGVKITGRDAVRVFYERTLSIFQQFDIERKKAKGLEPTREVKSAAFGETHIVAEMEEDFEFPDGRVERIRFLAVVEYRGDLMYGERLYSDHSLAEHVNDLLGEDFFERPDVTKIGGPISRQSAVAPKP